MDGQCGNSIEQMHRLRQSYYFCEENNLKHSVQKPIVQEIRKRLIVEAFCLIDFVAIKWMTKGQLGECQF